MQPLEKQLPGASCQLLAEPKTQLKIFSTTKDTKEIGGEKDKITRSEKTRIYLLICSTR